MSLFWSGPARALQAHLDLFSKVDRAHDWVEANAGKSLTTKQLFDAPFTVRQRMRLMTSMADGLGPEVIEHTADGSTLTAMRDDLGQLFTQRNVTRGAGLIGTEYEMLNAGETHYVSHHIAAAIEAAAALATDEPLYLTDLPASHGLIVLEYPLIMPDLHPDTGAVVPELEMPIRAIGWSRQEIHSQQVNGQYLDPGDGIFYSLYTDHESWQKLFLPSVREAMPEEWAEYAEAYEDAFDMQDPLWCIDTSGWSFGKSWKRSHLERPRESFELGEIHDTVATMRRFILTLFRFEWQRILVPQTYRPTRHEHRRAQRAGLQREDGYIKVLRLRRHVEAEARGESIDSDQLVHDHQWMVRGHPRRQWYPSLGPARNEDGSFNHDSHRLIWIEPFTKGNPYAPLVIGHNVTAVVH